jgi:hypothetical protein
MVMVMPVMMVAVVMTMVMVTTVVVMAMVAMSAVTVIGLRRARQKSAEQQCRCDAKEDALHRSGAPAWEVSDSSG